MQRQPIHLTREEMTDNIIIIKVNKFYRPGMSEQEKYEITRGIWRLNPKRARYARYVLSVYFGEIIEVYVPKRWQKAGETPYEIRQDLKDGVPLIDKNGCSTSGRYEFIGTVAPESVRARYVGKSVKALYNKGEANPIKYIYH